MWIPTIPINNYWGVIQEAQAAAGSALAGTSGGVKVAQTSGGSYVPSNSGSGSTGQPPVPQTIAEINKALASAQTEAQKQAAISAAMNYAQQAQQQAGGAIAEAMARDKTLRAYMAKNNMDYANQQQRLQAEKDLGFVAKDWQPSNEPPGMVHTAQGIFRPEDLPADIKAASAMGTLAAKGYSKPFEIQGQWYVIDPSGKQISWDVTKGKELVIPVSSSGAASAEKPAGEFKPDFTKENPYEGAPEEYIKSVLKDFKPTADHPVPPFAGQMADAETNTYFDEQGHRIQITRKDQVELFTQGLNARATARRTAIFEQNNVRLGDGTYISKEDFNNLPEDYKSIATSRGLGALNQAIADETRAFENNLKKESPDLFVIYKAHGYEAYKKVADAMMTIQANELASQKKALAQLDPYKNVTFLGRQQNPVTGKTRENSGTITTYDVQQYLWDHPEDTGTVIKALNTNPVEVIMISQAIESERKAVNVLGQKIKDGDFSAAEYRALAEASADAGGLGLSGKDRAEIWDKLTDAQKRAVTSNFANNDLKDNLISQTYSGFGYGLNDLSATAANNINAVDLARAYINEGRNMTPLDIAATAAGVALLMAPGIGGIAGRVMAGTLGGVIIANTAAHWNRMSNVERGLAVAFDAGIIAGTFWGMGKSASKEAIEASQRGIKETSEILKETNPELVKPFNNISKAQRDYVKASLKVNEIRSSLKAAKEIESVSSAPIGEASKNLEIQMAKNEKVLVKARQKLEDTARAYADAMKESAGARKTGFDTPTLLEDINRIPDRIVKHTDDAVDSIIDPSESKAAIQTIQDELDSAESSLRFAKDKYPTDPGKWQDLMRDVNELRGKLYSAKAGDIRKLYNEYILAKQIIPKLERKLTEPSSTEEARAILDALNKQREIVKTYPPKIRDAIRDLEMDIKVQEHEFGGRVERKELTDDQGSVATQKQTKPQKSPSLLSSGSRTEPKFRSVTMLQEAGEIDTDIDAISQEILSATPKTGFSTRQRPGTRINETVEPFSEAQNQPGDLTKPLEKSAAQTKAYFKTASQVKNELKNVTRQEPALETNPQIRPEVEPKTQINPRTRIQERLLEKKKPVLPDTSSLQYQGQTERDEWPGGSIVWNQGKLAHGETGQVVHHISPPPYKEEYTSLKPPKGMKNAELTSPKDTIQALGGKVKADADFKVGFEIVSVRKGANKISFAVDKELLKQRLAKRFNRINQGQNPRLLRPAPAKSSSSKQRTKPLRMVEMHRTNGGGLTRRSDR